MSWEIAKVDDDNTAIEWSRSDGFCVYRRGSRWEARRPGSPDAWTPITYHVTDRTLSWKSSDAAMAMIDRMFPFILETPQVSYGAGQRSGGPKPTPPERLLDVGRMRRLEEAARAVLHAHDEQTSAPKRAVRMTAALENLREICGVPRPKSNGMARRTKPYPGNL